MISRNKNAQNKNFIFKTLDFKGQRPFALCPPFPLTYMREVFL
jgi:hypothetical protein